MIQMIMNFKKELVVMICLDKNGFLVELIKGKWFKNFLCLFVYIWFVKCGVWDGFEVVDVGWLVDVYNKVVFCCKVLEEEIFYYMGNVKEWEDFLIKYVKIIDGLICKIVEFEEIIINGKVYNEKVFVSNKILCIEFIDSNNEFEQLCVQFVGCFIVVEGYINDFVKEGDYGWSFFY